MKLNSKQTETDPWPEVNNIRAMGNEILEEIRSTTDGMTPLEAEAYFNRLREAVRAAGRPEGGGKP